jgi:hypothetical protein
MASTGSLTKSVIEDRAEVETLRGSIEVRGSAAQQPARVQDVSIEGAPVAAREAGDEVNRFLLCALIRESAKHIKMAADRSGIYLPPTRIVRGLLQSYRRAAKENQGLLTGPRIDTAILKSLNQKIRKDEIERYSQQRVLSGQALLAHANGIGDQITIKAAEQALESPVSARDRLAETE